jgi:hypothetical protein
MTHGWTPLTNVEQLNSWRHFIVPMTNQVVKFNIGGVHYEVSQSLLNDYPNTMLSRSASKQWHEDPEAEIYIERDGDRFRLVLDYLRDNRVFLPVGSSKDALLMDLQYYGLENIKADDIIDEASTTFLFARCTMLVQELLDSWESKVIEHQRIVRELIDSKTILCAFSNTKSLNLYNLRREGGSFKNCNELLKSAGLCVDKEDAGSCWDQSTGKHLYNISLKLI